MLEKFYKIVAMCHAQFNTSGNQFLTKFELFATGKYEELAKYASKNIEKFISEVTNELASFKAAYQAKNIVSYYDNELGADRDIIKWHPDTESIDEVNIDGGFTAVDTTNGTTEAEMLKTAVKMSRKQAIAKLKKMVQDGEFDKNETYRIIFLNETKNGTPLKLICYRGSDGKLDLHVSEVYPVNGWYGAAYAWFSSNK